MTVKWANSRKYLFITATAACLILVNHRVMAEAASPDIVNVRLGMTPSEAMAAVKARPVLKYSNTWRETLTYKVAATQQQRPLPGGVFLSAIGATNETVTEKLSISFAPLPGKERVVAVSRSLVFPVGQQPLRADIIKSLIEKYGTPTITQGVNGPMMWSYDHNGSLRHLSSAQQGMFSYYCNQAIDPVSTNWVSSGTTPSEWVKMATPPGTTPNPALAFDVEDHGNPVANPAGICGSVLIASRGWVGNSNDPAFVPQLLVSMIGIEASADAQKAAAAMIKSAETGDLSKEINKAGKQKPDL